MKYAKIWSNKTNRWVTSQKNPHGVWPVNTVNKAVGQLRKRSWYSSGLQVVIFELTEVERKDV